MVTDEKKRENAGASPPRGSQLFVVSFFVFCFKQKYFFLFIPPTPF